MRPDHEWRCAGCGAAAPNLQRPCGCVTGVAYRTRDGKIESQWMQPEGPEFYSHGYEVREQLSPGIPGGASSRFNVIATCATVAMADHICQLLRANP